MSPPARAHTAWWATVLYVVAAALLFSNDLVVQWTPWRVVVLVALLPFAGYAIVRRARHPYLLAILGVVGIVGHTYAFLTLGMFNVALRVRGSRVWWVALVMGVIVSATYVQRELTDVTPPESATELLIGTLASLAVNIVGPVIVGGYIATRRDLERALRERAELAESERELRAERAVEAERSRIAREMHDSLGHSLALVTMQAGALQVSTGDAAVVTAADQIRRTARSGLADLRSVVRALGDASTELSPAPPGVDGLPALIAASRAAGGTIELVNGLPEGDADLVPPPIGRAVYHAIREGLTNAHRHAPGAAVHVRLSGRAGEQVAVEISNALAPGGEAGSGTGLSALTERVRLLGGTCRAEAAGGTFRLTIDLPWEEDS